MKFYRPESPAISGDSSVLGGGPDEKDRKRMYAALCLSCPVSKSQDGGSAVLDETCREIADGTCCG